MKLLLLLPRVVLVRLYTLLPLSITLLIRINNHMAAKPSCLVPIWLARQRDAPELWHGMLAVYVTVSSKTQIIKKQMNRDSLEKVTYVNISKVMTNVPVLQ